jgi:DNA-binding NarL/FixJ family response regulator
MLASQQEQKKDTIRIILVDDHVVTRQGIKALLQSNAFSVIGEASDGAEGLRLVETLQPELVLLDIDMPIMRGDALCKAIRERFPHIKRVVLTYHREVSSLAKLLAVGANGYLPKNVSELELKQALKDVMGGRTIVSADLIEDLDSEHLREYETAVAKLTKKERRVLRTLLTNPNLTNNSLANLLSVGAKTIEFHLSNTYGKLAAQNRADLIGESERWLVALSNFDDDSGALSEDS